MKTFKIGLPTLLIGTYDLILLLACLTTGLSLSGLFNDALVKFAMNGIFVLSLIPMINCGVGMNFGMPVGLSAGVVGLCLSFQLRLHGHLGFAVSLLFSVLIGLLFGWVYGRLLNVLKGREEIAGVFIGFAFIPLMNIFWTLAPFTNRQMLYPIGGVGLRPKISLNGYYYKILDNFGTLTLGAYKIPVGLLLFYGVMAILLAYLARCTLGKAMKALSYNPAFAKLSGVDENTTRLLSVMLSSAIAAVGMCVYTQSYGFIQVYEGATEMTFPAISALLIGGAISQKAKVRHAVMGTFLFQTAYLLSVPLANALMIPELAELIRMIITNSVILFAILYGSGRWQHAKA